MGEANAPILSFNAGVVSGIALARTDLGKLQVATEDQTNWFPKVMGPTIFRPGTEYRSPTLDNQRARLIDFVFNTATKAVLELTPNIMRVLLGGLPLVRPAVTAATVNGGFAVDLAGWTSIDEAGTVSDWAPGPFLRMRGTGYNYAGRRQQVTVSQPGVEHALRVNVALGPVTFRVGTAAGLDDLVQDTQLRAGMHSLAFVPPGGSFWIDIKGLSSAQKLVRSVQVEAAGELRLTTPWDAGHISSVRYAQSGDVLFAACAGIKQQRIERRSQRSWSVAEYITNDGPFLSPNTGTTVLTSTGAGLTASRPIFKPGHVGALFKLTTSGQGFAQVLAGDEQWTEAVRVSGVASTGTGARQIAIGVSGSFTGTLQLQRSLAIEGAWEDVAGQTYTAPASVGYDDGADNQIIYYRVGFKAGGYTSGSASVTLFYRGGTQTGVVRVVGYTSPTLVTQEILTQTTGIGTATWSEGAWSDFRGWPSSVGFHDGRQVWGRADLLFLSVSDAYESYDETITGDSAPIVRSVTTGGFEGILWILPVQRLLCGTAGQEVSIRSSSFDEPLTATAFTARECSTRGSYNIQAKKVDSRGIFVHRNGHLVFELVYDVNSQDYSSRNLTRLNEDICKSGIVDIAVQRSPDTRVWFVLGDGRCALLTYEREDEVVAWTPVETDGAFESVCILPGQEEDEIYFVVRRTVQGVEKRFIERLAKETEAVGDLLNKTMDAHITYSGSPITTLSAPWLAGRQVVAWADYAPLAIRVAPLTVATDGTITLPKACDNVVVGLAYPNGGFLKTSKLAYAAAKGAALTQRKRVDHLGILMARVCPEGVKIGRDRAHLNRLPTTYNGRPLTPGERVEFYDQDASVFNGAWDTDSRVCVEVQSPYCCTLMGMVVGITTNEHGTGAPAAPQSAPSKRS